MWNELSLEIFCVFFNSLWVLEKYFSKEEKKTLQEKAVQMLSHLLKPKEIKKEIKEIILLNVSFGWSNLPSGWKRLNIDTPGTFQEEIKRTGKSHETNHRGN